MERYYKLSNNLILDIVRGAAFPYAVGEVEGRKIYVISDHREDLPLWTVMMYPLQRSEVMSEYDYRRRKLGRSKRARFRVCERCGHTWSEPSGEDRICEPCAVQG